MHRTLIHKNLRSRKDREPEGDVRAGEDDEL
jgi:hypothetical protein